MAEPTPPSLALFRILFPEFASVSDETIQAYLDGNIEVLSMPAWGACYGRAVMYLAAHELALSQARIASSVDAGGVVVAPTGVVQSASAEGLSVSFAVPSNRSEYAAWLAQTPYGQRYLALMRSCLSRGRLSW